MPASYDVAILHLTLMLSNLVYAQKTDFGSNGMMFLIHYIAGCGVMRHHALILLCKL